ncbi:geraniol 8-hydroxylase-like [Mercurialis annua]|uniref:geraniol 8-hydroxylase-like n=1 Tax=Mercurialis annua TaxID=3986 RepID=UPI00215E0CE0|nr:geraniol 8-hydroxylase-like [Mercurialis annua]
MGIGLILIVIAIILSWIMVSKIRERRWVLPPGPMRLPLLGNLLQLGKEPHVSFAKLASQYGPIMTLWLGPMRTVVISSSEMAREMFKNHDTVLAGRKIYESMKPQHDNEGSLITAQYGSTWRLLRRLCSVELFTGNRLDASQNLRANSIDRMIKHLRNESENGTTAVDLHKCFFLMAFNHIGNLLLSQDLDQPNLETGSKFVYHICKIMDVSCKPNIADFVPILKWIDPQGIKRMTHFHTKQAFEVVQGFIDERIKIRSCQVHGGDGDKRKDFLDVLLDFHGDDIKAPSTLSSTFMKSIIIELFEAGTDTTSSTLEWAMTELFRNPIKLQKLQVELRSVINPGNQLEEKDIEHFPYLTAVIKETLRLHPPSPLLFPHRAMESCKMLGFDIPEDTQILVNVWAIGRDPKTWGDPLVFRPERFLEADMVVDYKGSHFQLLPFGSGRRMCPAVPLASRLLPFALGSVLHTFDWVLADDLKPEDLDMSEIIGLTLRKYVPLRAIPIPFKHRSEN